MLSGPDAMEPVFEMSMVPVPAGMLVVTSVDVPVAWVKSLSRLARRLVPELTSTAKLTSYVVVAT